MPSHSSNDMERTSFVACCRCLDSNPIHRKDGEESAMCESNRSESIGLHIPTTSTSTRARENIGAMACQTARAWPVPPAGLTITFNRRRFFTAPTTQRVDQQSNRERRERERTSKQAMTYLDWLLGSLLVADGLSQASTCDVSLTSSTRR